MPVTILQKKNIEKTKYPTNNTKNQTKQTNIYKQHKLTNKETETIKQIQTNKQTNKNTDKQTNKQASQQTNQPEHQKIKAD